MNLIISWHFVVKRKYHRPADAVSVVLCGLAAALAIILRGYAKLLASSPSSVHRKRKRGVSTALISYLYINAMRKHIISGEAVKCAFCCALSSQLSSASAIVYGALGDDKAPWPESHHQHA